MRTQFTLIGLFALLMLAACGRSEQIDPTPTLTHTPTPVQQQAAPPATATTTAVEPTEVPTEAPTEMPTAEPVAVPAETETPSEEAPTATTDNIESLWAVLPTEPPVECTDAGDVFHCHDVLLAMDYTYPVWMGLVQNTILREGGQAGYGYEYSFGDNQAGAGAGGRSRDFAEGRGGMFTDQLGFGGQSAEEYCAQRSELGFCQVIDGSTVMLVMLPQAVQFCSDWMMISPTPRAIVITNLPNHPIINGFGFTALLLPPEMDAEWAAAPQAAEFCTPENQAAYDAQVDGLRQGLPAGTADPAIQARYDALIQLAESIESPYAGTGGGE